MRKSRIMPGCRALASRYCCIIGVERCPSSVVRSWVTSGPGWSVDGDSRQRVRRVLELVYDGRRTTDNGLFGAVAQLGHGDGAAVVQEGDLGHVVADQQQAAAARAFEVLGGGGVGDVVGVEAGALVGDA